MKNMYKSFIALLGIMLIVSCSVDLAVTDTGSDKTLQDSLLGLVSTSENINGTNFSVTGLGGTLENNTSQLLTVSFTNGYVDNTTANLANIKVYRFTEPSTNVVYDRTEITKGNMWIDHSNGGSTVYITLDLAIADISDSIQVEVASAITADGSTKTLNQDADSISGESVEDIAMGTITVTDNNATLNTTAIASYTNGFAWKSPQTTFTFNLTNNTYDLRADLSALTTEERNGFTKASLNGSFQLQEYNFSTHAWSDVTSTVSSSYDSSTGLYDVDLPTADAGTVYRWTYNKYQVAQSNTVTGYIRRNSTDNYIDNVAANYISIDNGTNNYYDGGTITASAYTIENGKNAVKVDFAPTSGGIVSDSTITNDSLKIYYNTSGNTQYIAFTSMIKLTNNSYVFILNENVDLSSGCEVITYPTIVTDNNTPTNASDDKPFGNYALTSFPSITGTF